MGDGACPKSYGMNVALMAGIDPKITEDASIISTVFEELHNKYHQQGKKKEGIISSLPPRTKQDIANILNSPTPDKSSILGLWQFLQTHPLLMQ
jgi:DNA mismatch repair ATPase MutS